jgi:hypothetical protein
LAVSFIDPPGKIINFVPEHHLILNFFLSSPDHVQTILNINPVQMDRHLISVWQVMPDTKPTISHYLPN